MIAPARRSAGLLLLAVCLGAACATGVRRTGGEPPLRISEVAAEGDAARRASTRLVLTGLEDDAVGRPEAARASYERALRVDATNPWAYLALARHHADGVDPASALPYLDQAEALLESEGGIPPRAEAHLLGLRGQALQTGPDGSAGEALLVEARRGAPSVWDDGRLSAAELR